MMTIRRKKEKLKWVKNQVNQKVKDLSSQEREKTRATFPRQVNLTQIQAPTHPLVALQAPVGVAKEAKELRVQVVENLKQPWNLLEPSLLQLAMKLPKKVELMMKRKQLATMKRKAKVIMTQRVGKASKRKMLKVVPTKRLVTLQLSMTLNKKKPQLLQTDAPNAKLKLTRWMTTSITITRMETPLTM